jgi:5-(carboxyamino)imidazole ribonucleotide synthase
VAGIPALAVVGGGQLARMMAQAAVGLGVEIRLLAEGPDVSAAQVVPGAVVGDYRDLETLRTVADGCAAVTFDHEHVPPEHLRALTEEGRPCRPGPAALVHAQDKGIMRARMERIGVPGPRHRLVTGAAEVAEFAASVGGFPVVLKTTRGGYDGKGVWVVDDEAGCAVAFDTATATGVGILAEEKVDFRRELSAIVARSPSGQVAAYPVVESVQRDGICWEVTAPAPDLDESLAHEAQLIAMTIAAELDVTGVLAVEMFETVEPTPGAALGSATGRVLVNELAMRPHNTGHWSMDGAVTGQFENHLRAVLDLPLGSPRARAPWTVMVNILGGPHGGLSENLYAGYPHVFARDPALKVHLYGKDVKPGRKVGHVTAYGDDLAEVRERARHAAAWFRGELGDESE